MKERRNRGKGGRGGKEEGSERGREGREEERIGKEGTGEGKEADKPEIRKDGQEGYQFTAFMYSSCK